MRTRTALLPTLFVASTLVIVPALPAAAATTTWTQASDAWWSTATWSTTVPVAGDDVVFNGGPRSTYNLGDVDFASFTFDATHQVAGGGGEIGLTGGLNVAPGVTARVDPNINVRAAQSWTIASGSSLEVPSWITTDGVGALTLAVDGQLVLSGNLDALGTGAVTQTGTGVVVRSGGAGGGIGAGGYNVTSGTFRLDGASIGGTDVQVTGGALDGPGGEIGALRIDAGVLAPGVAGVGELGLIGIQRNLALDGGAYLYTVDPGASDADYLLSSGSVSGTGTRLMIDTLATPTVGDVFAVLGAWRGGTVDAALRLLSPDGVTLADGDEFVADGGRWSIDYITGTDGVVEVEYLGAAPVVTPPPSPAPRPALANTGLDDGLLVPVGIGAGVLILLGVGALIVGRLRSRGHVAEVVADPSVATPGITAHGD